MASPSCNVPSSLVHVQLSTALAVERERERDQRANKSACIQKNKQCQTLEKKQVPAVALRTHNEDERRHQPSHGQPSQAQGASSSSTDLSPAGSYEPPVGGSPGMCCAVLCCAVLCCAVLCCAVLAVLTVSCAVLCCAVLCCAVLCCVTPKIKHDQLCFPLLLSCSLVLL